MYKVKSKNSDIKLCGVGDISYFFYYLCCHESQDICKNISQDICENITACHKIKDEHSIPSLCIYVYIYEHFVE